MAEHAWDEVKARFNAALSLSLSDREKYLDQLSTESSQLHHDVVEMLANLKSADEDGFLESLAIGKKTETELIETLALNFPTIDVSDASADVSDASASSESMCTLSRMAEIDEMAYLGEIGDYQLIEKIGRGGMGVVYKARQKKVDRLVALKVIAAGSLCAAEDIARFQDEASAAGRLNHPGIVAVYDAGEHDGTHYFSMAYIEGVTLAAYVGEDKPRIEPRRAAQLMEKVCRAVQYAHDRAVIHRDIKPANIMLDKSGEPLLTDFGLAKLVGSEGLTMTGQVMGTPNYMAPEQAKGQQELMSTRTDVYSLGATLYALLAGTPAFVGKDLLDTLRKVESAAPQSLSYKGSPVPLDLWTICEKSLSKKPDDRYESASALADDLQRYLQGFPITARAVGPWTRLERWCQRNPLIATLIGAIAATLVIATIVSINFALQARAALREKEVNANRLNEAIEDTFMFASENLLADEPGMQDVRQTLLENAQRYYEQMIQSNPGSEEKIADTSYLLGKINSELGSYAEARESLERSLEIQIKLVELAADKKTAYLNLANVHSELAKLGEKIWNSRALAEAGPHAKKSLRDALRSAELCVEWRNKALAEDSNDRETQRLLASAQMNLGVLLTEEFGQNQLDETQSKASHVLRQAQALREDLLKDNPDETKLRQDLARGFAALARLADTQAGFEPSVDRQTELIEQSLNLQLQATQTLEDLPSHARTSESQSLLATCYRLCGRSHYQMNKIDRAISDYEKSIEIMQQLTLNNPRVYSYRQQAALAQFEIAQVLVLNGDNRGYEFAYACQQSLVEGLGAEPKSEKAADLLLELTDSLCSAFLEQSFSNQAIDLIEQAKQMLDKVQVFGSNRSLIDRTIKTLEARANMIREQLETQNRTT